MSQSASGKTSETRGQKGNSMAWMDRITPHCKGNILDALLEQSSCVLCMRIRPLRR